MAVVALVVAIGAPVLTVEAAPVAANPSGAPKTEVAKPGAANHVTGHVAGTNSHLHVSAGAKAKVAATLEKSKHATTHVSRRVRVIHLVHNVSHPVYHGGGTIEGVVHSASGGAGGVQVFLAKSNGHGLRTRRLRHATTTDASGQFAMIGVSARRYRVVAVRSSHRASVKTRVRNGAVSHVQIGMKK